ncbi:MAG: carbohydrate-binding family 9-like protein [Desulfosudis oleivorans]|nr:carbohydrate-binding family 9-like protein [Desulfosudis oleivorans]
MTLKAHYGCDERELAHYTCHRAPHQMAIDGRLDRPAWRVAPKSHRFVDLVTGVPGFLDTRMASLWDDEYLYVAFWVSEPDVRAKLIERDALVWTENDVEIFIGGEDCYYEFEINALGTVYEVFYVWQDAPEAGEPVRRSGVRPDEAPGRCPRRLPGRPALRQASAGPALGFPGLRSPRPEGGGPGPGDAQRPVRRRRGLDGRGRLPLGAA